MCVPVSNSGNSSSSPFTFHFFPSPPPQFPFCFCILGWRGKSCSKKKAFFPFRKKKKKGGAKRDLGKEKIKKAKLEIGQKKGGKKQLEEITSSLFKNGLWSVHVKKKREHRVRDCLRRESAQKKFVASLVS